MRALPVMIPSMMTAVVTTGYGGFDKLEIQQVPVPEPASGEVLVRVLAAGINNTEINTRLGWYSASVTNSTDDAAAAAAGHSDGSVEGGDGGWNDATPIRCWLVGGF